MEEVEFNFLLHHKP